MSSATHPPYQLRRQSGLLLFDLVPNALGTPTEEEVRFAARLARIVDAARDLAARGHPLHEKFDERLMAAAETAVSGPAPRRPEVALFVLAWAERSLLGPFRSGNMSTPDAIKLMRNLAAPGMTDDQRAFMAELEQQERLIRSLFRGEEKSADFLGLMQRARSAAEIGLLDVPADVRLARFAMAGLVQDAMRERGQKARARYLERLGSAYVVTFVRVALVLLIFWGLLKVVPAEMIADPLKIGTVQLLLLGVALAALFGGAWLSAVARVQPDSPEVLDGIFTNTFTAPLRSLFILGFGLIAILLLYKQAVIFSFGSQTPAIFSSAEVLNRLSAAILTGAFLGFGEAALPNAVIQRSSGLVSSIGGGAAAGK